MGLLDITLGAEDQQTMIGAGMFVAGAALTVTGVGAAPGAALMIGGAGMAASGVQGKNARKQQEEAISDQKRDIENARFESLLRQVSAEIQADQTMLATLNSGSNNKSTGAKPGINTQQNQQVGSSTSGTF